MRGRNSNVITRSLRRPGHMCIDDLPRTMAFGPDIGKAQGDREGLAAIGPTKRRDTSHDSAVRPHFFDRLPYDEGLELVTRRRIVRDQLCLALDRPGAVEQSVVICEQSFELRPIAFDLRRVVVLDGLAKIRRKVGRKSSRVDEEQRTKRAKCDQA
jgi:hypothetical protein